MVAMSSLRLIRIIKIILSVTITHWSWAQDSSYEELFRKLDDFRANSPQEKVYVHFNETYYQSGEEVWFKVYQVDADKNVPSAISEVVYINLYDPDDSLVSQTLAKMIDGFGYGSFQIPNGLNDGVYTVKAYTNWMLNFNHDLVFSDHLMVYGRDNEYAASNNENRLQVDFFPEGGHCSVGIPCRIGIMSKRSGTPQSVEGSIYDESGEELARFETGNNGVGSVFFSPTEGKDYYAFIQGYEMRFGLPSLREEGFSMQVRTTSKSEIQVVIYGTQVHQEEKVRILLITQGEIRFAAKAKLKDGATLINLPTDSLPTGVAQVTLFNADGLPELERLIFIDNQPDTSPFKVEVEKNSWGNREKVKVKFNSTKISNSNDGMNLSVSVKEKVAGNNLKHKNIRDYFLIGSELINFSGVNYYSPGNTSLSKEGLDEILMVQGWRRYNWMDIVDGVRNEKKYIPERGGFHLSGRLVDSLSGRPIVGSHVFASSSGMPSFFEYTLSDSQGRFSFFQLDFFGSHPVVLSIDDTLSLHEKAKIEIGQRKVDFKLKNKLIHLNRESGSVKRDLRTKQQVSDFYSIYRSNDLGLANNRLVSSNNPDSMFLTPDKLLKMEDYVELPNMREVIRELLHGVRLRDRDGVNELRVMIYVHDDFDDSDVLRYYDEGPLVLVNGHPTFNLDSLVRIDPNEIDSVGINYGRQRRIIDRILDKTAFDGVLQIFADGIGEELQSQKSLEQMVNGFQQYREFYSPDYEDLYDPRIPDLRTNLYWNPEVKTENGEGNFEFYTSDLKTDYEIIIQGISSDGDVIYERVNLSVE